jgi:hypothetical protein
MIRAVADAVLHGRLAVVMARTLGLDDEVPATECHLARGLHVADGASALGKAATVGGGLTANGAFHRSDSIEVVCWAIATTFYQRDGFAQKS